MITILPEPYIEGGSNLNVIANELTVNNADYGFYAKENSELNISGGTLEVNADSYGVYLKNSHGKYNFNKLTLNSGKYGIYANEASTLDIMADELTVNNKSMDTNYGIYLNSASTGTVTAHSIRIENSKFGLLADDNSTLDVKNTGSYTFTNGSGDDDVAFSYLRNSKGELTIGTVDINNAGFGFNAREESSFTFKGNSIEFTNTRNAVKINDKSQADFEVGEFTVEGGAYALAAENKSKIDLSANVITVNLDDNTGNESAVYATDKSNIDITAASMTLIGNKSVYAHGYSKYTQKAEDVTLNGQVKAGDGASEIFSGVTDEGSGVVRISTTNKDAVTAYSYIYAPSSIEFNQASFINSQGDEEYHADKQGVRTNSAIRANRNSVITLDKAAGIYGDIIAGKGKIEKENVGDNDVNLDELSGGKITINSMEGATFKGDILAGNTGTIDFTLNNASYEGRVDDYADATLKHDVFRPGEFDVDVTEGGTVNMTLNDSTWTAHGQNFVTSLTFGESGGLVDLSQDENNSVTIRELNGDGTFHMLLNSENHALSDMLYIGKNTGIQTINIIGGITGGLEAISEDNPLRFATVGVDGSELPDVRNSGVRAYTRDAGALDLEYFVAKEEFDKADAENEAYNGTGKDETVDKPGNEFVENELVGDRDTAVNWIITGVREAKRSDAGKTVIAMSRANYSNAIYMDRLNKRMGEARYIDGDEGLWVRMRHDRIGKSDAFRSKNTMFELGYDRRVGDREDGEHRQGFVLDYMRGTAEYQNVAGDGDVRRGGIWLYDTWLGDKGHYTDYVFKIGRLSNDFEIYARSTGEKITGDYSNFVYSASAEYGRKKNLGNDWYIEPQAQIQYAHVTDADYTTSQDTQVELDAIDSLIGRVGFRLGRDIGEKNNFYIKADILHEFLGDQDIRAKDNTGLLRTMYENKGTWYDIGLGFSHEFSKGTYMFFDVEKSFGNDNEDTYQFNVGMNWKV